MITKKEFLAQLASDTALLEVARLAIEDVLIARRDARISTPLRGNGLVCREPNGQASSLIRMGSEEAVAIALEVIAENLPDPEEKVV